MVDANVQYGHFGRTSTDNGRFDVTLLIHIAVCGVIIPLPSHP